MVGRMSAVEVASLGVATAALGAAAVLGLALARTRRTIGSLQQAVDRMHPASAVEAAEAVEVTPHLLESPPPAPSSNTVAVTSEQRVVSVTMGAPLVRASALTYGLRRALRPEHRDRVSALMRRDLRRRRKLRQRNARQAARTATTHPGTPS